MRVTSPKIGQDRAYENFMRSLSPLILSRFAYEDFSGNNHMVLSFGKVSYGSWMNATDLTISLWFKPVGSLIAGWNQLITRDDEGANRSWRIDINGDGRIRQLLWDVDGTLINDASSDPVVTVGSWHHLAVRMKSTTDADLWLNGSQLFHNTGFAGGPFAGSADMYYAASGGVKTFDGYLDYLALFPSALSDTEISKLYTLGQ